MARRGRPASVREQAIELLARGDTEPTDIAKALSITDEALRELRRTRLFGEAVLARTHRMLDESMPFVLRRIIDQAEAGQAAQQKILIDYRLKLKELEAASSSERWKVGWSSAPPPAGPPTTAAEKDAEE